MSSPQSSEIRSRLRKNQVTIEVVERENPTILIRKGTIDDIDPGRWIRLSGRDGGNSVFCGPVEGISRILSSDGTVIFENPGVPAEYTRHKGLHTGVVDYMARADEFFRQMEAAYDSLRAQGQWNLD